LCQIAKPEDMPVDQNGNRADIIMDPNSTVSRMNLGRVYEMYINITTKKTRGYACRSKW
jgi:DNA-directed RNA polymerase beta subunit